MLWTTVGACGCSNTEPPTRALPSAAPAPKPPVDQVLPGEIAEGPDQAFGFPIPRKMRVQSRFSDAIFAVGDISAERLSNYVRQRVIADKIETGPAKTVFSRATVKSSPHRILRIEVVSRFQMAELVIRDETAPAAEQGVSEEEQWRRKGLKPDGTPLDPKHFE